MGRLTAAAAAMGASLCVGVCMRRVIIHVTTTSVGSTHVNFPFHFPYDPPGKNEGDKKGYFFLAFKSLFEIGIGLAARRKRQAEAAN